MWLSVVSHRSLEHSEAKLWHAMNMDDDGVPVRGRTVSHGGLGASHRGGHEAQTNSDDCIC